MASQPARAGVSAYARTVDAYRSHGPLVSALERAARGRLRVDPTSDGLCLRWRWLNLRIVPSLFAAIAGTSLLGHWELRGPLPALFIFGGIALAGWYGTIAYLANSTRIVVDAMSVRVRHGPIPWLGGGQWWRDEIAQVYVDELVQRSGRGARYVYYTVMARSSTGKALELVNGPLDADRAKAIEATLELCLGIENEKVPGEYEGG